MSAQPHTWPRLFVDAPMDEGALVALTPEASHYLLQVMRLQAGEPVRLFNGRDGEWQASLAEQPKSKKAGAVLRLETLMRPQTPEPDLWLCAAPIKKAHFDFMIEKATELGVSRIQPVLTARTQVREVNVERCRTLAIEAAEQSERLTLPEIRPALSLEKLLADWPSHRPALLCAESGQAQPVAEALSGALTRARQGAALFTGPEGGFEAEEMEKIRALPEALSLRLGPRILRADTAALAALACWQALCGDWQRRGQDGDTRPA